MSVSRRTGSESKGIPIHVGIIMDGNGRWAEQRKRPRTNGHREGLVAAKRIVSAAADRGIRFLTLYVFSTENWKRTNEEVSFLMRLITQHLSKEYDFYREKGIRVVHSGDIAGLPDYVRQEIVGVTKDTGNFTSLTLNLAINYGGRSEIIRSVRRFLESENGREASDLTEEAVSANLDIPELPDPDLIIRSAGEMRMSNFLLWQSAYAEFYVSDTLWPDWTEEDLDADLSAYAGRHRKFGGVP